MNRLNDFGSKSIKYRGFFSQRFRFGLCLIKGSLLKQPEQKVFPFDFYSTWNPGRISFSVCLNHKIVYDFQITWG